LAAHPLYQQVDTVEKLKRFMETHIFAVWDFMSLLKSLQKRVTCVDLPWRPSPYPDFAVRLVNEIVLGEESDVSFDGEAISHFKLYIQAMKEVGASTTLIEEFLTDMNLGKIPDSIGKFVAFNLDVAQNGSDIEVAAVFFFGREKLVPMIFRPLLAEIKQHKHKYQSLIYYLERHIDIDENSHGPLGEKLLNFMAQENKSQMQLALNCAHRALQERKNLWDSLIS